MKYKECNLESVFVVFKSDPSRLEKEKPYPPQGDFPIFFFEDGERLLGHVVHFPVLKGKIHGWSSPCFPIGEVHVSRQMRATCLEHSTQKGKHKPTDNKIRNQLQLQGGDPGLKRGGGRCSEAISVPLEMAIERGKERE